MSIERDVVINVAVKYQQPPAAAMAAPFTAVEKAADSADVSVKMLTKGFDALEKELEQSNKKLEETARKLNEVKDVPDPMEGKIAGMRKMHDTAMQLAGGLGQLVSGLAFLQMAGEETSAEMIRTYAAMQSGVATFAGLVGMVNALTVAFPALTVAMGPWGIALAAIAGVTAAVVSITRKMGEESKAAIEKSNAAWEKRVDTVNRYKDATSAVRDSILATATAEERAAAATNKRNEAQRNLEHFKNRSGSGDDTLGDLEQRMELSDRYAEAIRAEQAAKNAILDTEQESLKVQLSKLDAADKAAKAERDKLTTIEEQIGRLDKMQKLELEGLIAKANRGEELTNAQLEKLQQLAPATASKVSEQFAEKGRKDSGLVAGVAGLTGVDTTPDGADPAERKRLTDALAESKDKEAKNIEEMVTVLETIAKRMDVVTKKVRQLSDSQFEGA